MKTSEVMTSKVISIDAEASIDEAVHLMVRHSVSGLPVIDDGGGLAGILTEGDLLRRAEMRTERRYSGWRALLFSRGRMAKDYVRSHATKVRELMTTQVETVDASAPLADVVALMETRRIKRLPVFSAGKLVGIVSRADLLRALQRLLPQPDPNVLTDVQIRRHILAEISKEPWAPRARVDVKVKEGVVELQGIVTDLKEREGLQVLAENTPGVREVRNDLIWVEPMSGIVLDPPVESR